jgi:hypothetical protein
MGDDDILYIRDKRVENRFFIDNVFIDDYGPIVGVYGIAVYSAIVRHSNPDGTGAFPSYNRIAAKIGCCVTKVKESVQQLIDLKLIASRPRFKKDGSQTSNAYFILQVPPRATPAATDTGGTTDNPPGVHRTPTTNPPSSDQSTISPEPFGTGESPKKEPAFDRARISRALNATLTKPEDEQDLSPLAEYVKQEMGLAPTKGQLARLALPFTERKPGGDVRWPSANKLWDTRADYRRYVKEQVAYYKKRTDLNGTGKRNGVISTITAFKHAKGYGFLDWLAKEEDAARATAPQTLPPAPEPYISDEQAAEDAAYIQDRINRKLI